jgi:hypothetical protein
LLQERGSHFDVAAELPLEIIRPGNLAEQLTSHPIHLQSVALESDSSAVAQLVTLTNRIGLLANEAGKATLLLRYRVPVIFQAGRQSATVPLFQVTSGELRIESPRANLDLAGGSLWSRSTSTNNPALTVIEAGVAGEDAIAIQYSESTTATTASGPGTGPDNQLYGIGLRQARHLTVINSDGSCTHFSEYELPASQASKFQLRLPPTARLISASINGTEIKAPALSANALCEIPLPPRESGTDLYRISFRLALAPVQLGFLGSLELSLPEIFQTTGTLDWVIALPEGFQTRLISSNLQQQREPAQLEVFGDYGNVISDYPYTHLAKALAPPGNSTTTLGYRQILPRNLP